ncbi:MAG: hypothetical protein Q4B43_10390 [Bacteroidota bacterium]|nr:hypothetical protein [Bacteroidota bacterium]
MNINELINKLEKKNISKDLYSLDGYLKSDALILREQSLCWEVFYFDEKGNEQDNKIFETESEACEYLYRVLIENMNIKVKYNIN